MTHKVTFKEALTLIQYQSPGIMAINPEWVNDYKDELQEKIDTGILTEEAFLKFYNEAEEFVSKLHKKIDYD